MCADDDERSSNEPPRHSLVWFSASRSIVLWAIRSLLRTSYNRFPSTSEGPEIQFGDLSGVPGDSEADDITTLSDDVDHCPECSSRNQPNRLDSFDSIVNFHEETPVQV